ncbi:hypothetical protein PG987_012671 [Apiospora arundinis]
MELSELSTPATLDFLDAGDQMPTGLDYGSFVNDDKVRFPQTPLRPGRMPPPPPPPLSQRNINPWTARQAAKKQRLERKGHTKSRRGCYNCKKRRIKCQETYPSCEHCNKTGLNCEYPAVPQVVHQPQHQIPLFSLQDMRFFQHFLMNCVPHHPLGNEAIWTHEMPCLAQNLTPSSAHQHEYLMHAMLGLAASDLLCKDASLLPFAMAHRVKAIKAIKKTLNEVPKHSNSSGSGTNNNNHGNNSTFFEEGNALMATCFALTFQSVLLDDGMAEFMTFCRGVVLVAIQMYCKGARFLFTNWVGKDEMALLQPLMETVPPIRPDWVDAALAGVRGLEPLCVHPVETEYHKLLVDMVEALYTSPFRGYQIICKHYGWWLQIPHERFQYLIDPTNHVCNLLATHWIAIKQIMAPVTEKEHLVNPQERPPRDKHADLGTIRWLKYLNHQLPLEYRGYNRWPVWVEEQLDRDLACFGRTLG